MEEEIELYFLQGLSLLGQFPFLSVNGSASWFHLSTPRGSINWLPDFFLVESGVFSPGVISPGLLGTHLIQRVYRGCN